MNIDDLESYEVGQPMDEPMTEQQRKTLYTLIYNAILNPDQKEAYRRALDQELTWNEAETMKQELRVIQLPVLDQYNPYEKERNKAIFEMVNRENT